VTVEPLPAPPATEAPPLPAAPPVLATPPAVSKERLAEVARFLPGNRVSLRNLKKNAGFNGQYGTVLAPEENATMAVPGTVRVLLDAGPEVAAKPQNLELIATEAFMAPPVPFAPLPGLEGLQGEEEPVVSDDVNRQEQALERALAEAAMMAESCHA